MKTERDTYVEDVNKGRIDMMKKLEALKVLEDPTESEKYRDVLCIDTLVVKKILLSTGGPEDGFKLYFDIDHDSKQSPPALLLSHGVYYRAEWGTYKEASLSDDEAQQVFDFYMGGYCEL